MRFRPDILSYFQEVIFPEYCMVCNAARGTVAWAETGVRLDSLRRWDSPHLCRRCYFSLKEKDPIQTELDLGLSELTMMHAAQRTNPQLVAMVSAWKYHGVRGLVWPLSALMSDLPLGRDKGLGETWWVPVPLHRRRQRQRGFNQARMLAAQLAHRFGGVFMPDLVVRRKPTLQQARLVTSQDRLNNVQNVFSWAKNRGMGDLPSPCRIMIVDDIVTSGATAGALGRFLEAGGLKVTAIVCLGAAKQDIPVG